MPGKWHNRLEAEVAIHIAANVRRLREQRGLTQAEMAERAEIPRPTWASLENQPGNPTIGLLMKVARAFDVNVGFLIEPLHLSKCTTRRRGWAACKQGDVR